MGHQSDPNALYNPQRLMQMIDRMNERERVNAPFKGTEQQRVALKPVLKPMPLDYYMKRSLRVFWPEGLVFDPDKDTEGIEETIWWHCFWQWYFYVVHAEAHGPQPPKPLMLDDFIYLQGRLKQGRMLLPLQEQLVKNLKARQQLGRKEPLRRKKRAKKEPRKR